MNAKDIIEQAGGIDAVARRIGAKSVDYVRVKQYAARLPASWYAALEDMTGQQLPRHLFSFKGLDA